MIDGNLLPAIIEDCLPIRIKLRINALAETGRFRDADISEIRLRLDQPVSLSVGAENLRLDETLSHSELADCVAMLCRGSVYAHDDTIREGYIRVEGGIRVGVCGTLAGDGRGVREITSLNIRIPHAIRGVCEKVLRLCLDGTRIRSLLIYSPPGVGKTTLLRDLASQLAGKFTRRVALLDTRGELFIKEMFRDTLCDVLVGYPRAAGIEIATRTLSPEVIICDELGDEAEARQILGVQNTGVPIIASAHASSADQLLRRPNIALLHENHVFAGYVGITRERISGKLSRQFTCTYTPWMEETEAELCRV